MPGIRLAVFDMAGTTVDDVIDGVPLVLRSYDDAFKEYGVEVPMPVLNEQRGRDKWTVIREFGGAEAHRIYEFFLSRLLENTGRVREIPGTSETFKFLRRRGVWVVAGTGFPEAVAEQIILSLGWLDEGLIDSWLCSETVGASRPDPAMIHSAMQRFGLSDPRAVLKVDDTAKGIEEGLAAGAVTVGVLTGTQSEARLRAAGATDILSGVWELPDFLVENGLV